MLKKSLFAVLTAAMVVGMIAISVFHVEQSKAQSLSDLEASNASPVRWSIAWKDQSLELGQVKTIFQVMYRFDVHGGALGNKALGPKTTSPIIIPANFIVVDAWIDIQEPILPATSTNAIFIQSAADVATGTVAFATTGLKVSVVDGTFANAFKNLTNANVNLVTTGNAITSGSAIVFIEGYKSF
ncbi:MAG: hypothetical protein IH951_11840 [Bacteroidetes bacterium]|nr:hypothetical protein [Bacteroidota bacterium]